jgi:hypothetical protein
MTLSNVTFIRATIQLQTLIHQQGPNVHSMVNKSREKKVPRKVLQILRFERWGVLLYIKREVPPFGLYAPLPALVPLLEAILQAIHCDPIQHCHCIYLKSSELANSHPFCSFNCGKW